MPELTITKGPGTGTKIALTPEQAYSLGSGDQDSVRIAGHGVVPKHVVVRALKSGGFGVKAVEGTFRHNGEDVQVTRLAQGDRVDIGECTLEYNESTRDAAATPAQNDPARPPTGARSKTGDLPTEIGGFRLFEQIGKGGMGVVYRAEQVSLGREVALKVLSHNLTSDPEFIEKFVAEARAAARLHHPNVVQVFDVDNVDDTYFYSMELMAKGSLEDRLRRDKKVPVDEAVQMIRDAAAGLGFAESMRIVHRDIKPDNLMVDQHGHVKIADLGLAQVDDESESSGKLFGTPHFMSPEQIQRKPLDHRSDLYSLGCTFYRLVTGRTPCRGSNVKEILRAQVRQAPEPACKVEPLVSSDVSGTIDRLLAKDPEERYQSAADFIEELDAVSAPPTRKGILIGSVAVSVIAIGAIIWGITREDRVIEKVITETTGGGAQSEADAAALREMTAKADYLDAKSRPLERLAKATALESVAEKHAGTEWAKTATKEATELRDFVARDEAAATARRTAIEAARSELVAGTGNSIERGDFRAAAKGISLDGVNETIRNTAELRAAAETLTGQLALAGATRIKELRGSVAKTAEAGQVEALCRHLVALENLLEGDNAWPDAAIPDRLALERFVQTSRAKADRLAADSLSLATQTAWNSAVASLLGPDGIATRLRNFEFTAAAREATAASERVGNTSAPGLRLARLASATIAGARFLDDFRRANDGGGDDPSGKADPANGGTDDLAQIHTIPGADADDPNRAAFLALLGIARHAQTVREYLGRVRSEDDASGTMPDDVFQAESVLFEESIVRSLRTAPHDWATPLLTEFLAARLTARALRAFSSRRNTAAAELLDRAVHQYPDTFVLRGLR